MMTNFHVGQNFSSFSEFERYLFCYEKDNFVKFSKRYSRKIQTALQSGRTKVKLNPDLIYYEIRYNCVRGGSFRVQGTGKRKTSSRKVECSAHISLRAAADGKSLSVKSFDSAHNHEVSKVLFDHLPQQRRLTEGYKNKARELLRLKANKKLIQQKLQEETGKIVTLRDLSNLAKSVKSSSNELHEAVSFLQEEYHVSIQTDVGEEVEVLTSKEDASIQTDVCEEVELQSSKEGVEEWQKSLLKLLESGNESDVVLKVKGKEFPAHRILLQARSTVFEAMFSHNIVEKQSGVVTMEDCDPETFPDFLKYIYTGNTDMISTKNVFSLYFASDKYDLNKLKKQCVHFIKRNLTVASFWEAITLVVKYDEKDLIELVTEFFCANTLDIIKTVDWQRFLTENPIVGNELFIASCSQKK